MDEQPKKVWLKYIGADTASFHFPLRDWGKTVEPGEVLGLHENDARDLQRDFGGEWSVAADPALGEVSTAADAKTVEIPADEAQRLVAKTKPRRGEE